MLNSRLSPVAEVKQSFVLCDRPVRRGRRRGRFLCQFLIFVRATEKPQAPPTCFQFFILSSLSLQFAGVVAGFDLAPFSVYCPPVPVPSVK
ncbi:hypothetical protein EYF80_015808 [Liparis tanakae]|uniref:Uncharacterized protein n=1 Tax=Liparis tanakae TaxID=230148 RepID=A0A4Z2I7G5_9TELE|nr:hypothetical protein EYF80_015808 [Liparis tanakae]